jgi:hypothetical protein
MADTATWVVPLVAVLVLLAVALFYLRRQGHLYALQKGARPGTAEYEMLRGVGINEQFGRQRSGLAVFRSVYDKLSFRSQIEKGKEVARLRAADSSRERP